MTTAQTNLSYFKISEVQDNWNSHAYIGSRYLDSLAAVLAIQGPSTAVTYFNDRFLVSYNTTSSDLTTSIFYDLIPLIQQSSANDILPYYFIFNVDFKKILRLILCPWIIL